MDARRCGPQGGAVAQPWVQVTVFRRLGYFRLNKNRCLRMG